VIDSYHLLLVRGVRQVRDGWWRNPASASILGPRAAAALPARHQARLPDAETSRDRGDGVPGAARWFSSSPQGYPPFPSARSQGSGRTS